MFGKIPSEKIISIIQRQAPETGSAYIPACGYGGLVLHLLDQGWSVTATDTNKSVLDYIERTRPKNDRSRLVLRQQDIRLPIDDSFDLIVVANVLHFFTNTEARQCIKNTAGLLKNKGILIIRTFGDRDDLCTKGKFFPTEKEMQQILINLELSVLETERYAVTESHPPIGKHSHDILIFTTLLA